MTENKSMDVNTNIALPDISKAFNFERLRIVKRLGGLQAQNWLVEADGVEFVLKKYNLMTVKRLKFIEAFNEMWYNSDIPVALPIQCVYYNRSVIIHDQCYAMIPYSLGIIKHEPTITNQELLSAGRILARIHKVEPKVQGVAGGAFEDVDGFNHVSPNIENRNGSYYSEITRELIQRKKELGCKINIIPFVDRPRPCHGDFHNENVLFDQAGNVDRIIDFEYCHWGDPALDVAKFIDLACCTTGYGAVNQKKAALFLQGYRSINQLASSDVKRGLFQRFHEKCIDRYFEDRVERGEAYEILEYVERDTNKMTELSLKFTEIVSALSA